MKNDTPTKEDFVVTFRYQTQGSTLAQCLIELLRADDMDAWRA